MNDQDKSRLSAIQLEIHSTLYSSMKDREGVTLYAATILDRWYYSGAIHQDIDDLCETCTHGDGKITVLRFLAGLGYLARCGLFAINRDASTIRQIGRGDVDISRKIREKANIITEHQHVEAGVPKTFRELLDIYSCHPRNARANQSSLESQLRAILRYLATVEHPLIRQPDGTYTLTSGWMRWIHIIIIQQYLRHGGDDAMALTGKVESYMRNMPGFKRPPWNGDASSVIGVPARFVGLLERMRHATVTDKGGRGKVVLADWLLGVDY